MRRWFLWGILALAIALWLTPLVVATPHTLAVKLIAFNDFHGNLEPANLSFVLPNQERVPAGGVEYLATYIKQLRAKNPNHLVVSAGDSIGATPLLSALFHDEPTIEAMNELRLDLNAVGNHEFDQGAKELMRLIKGGCHPRDGCRGGTRYGGAKFQYLAANVIDQATGKPILPAYSVKTFGGIKIAFIGMTLEGTPRLVSPSGVAGLTFANEAETINALVPELQRQGIKAIVVLLHEGGIAKGNLNQCDSISGAIANIVPRTNPEVDLFITGHTHQAYNCVIDGRVVTSASAFGRVLTEIDLTLDRRTQDIKTVKANNLVVTHDVPRAGEMTNLIAKYKAIADPLANRIIGEITADLTRQASPAGEMPLGNIIADAQLFATQAPDKGGAVIALMNSGGIRAELTYKATAQEGDGKVTYGEAFAVQPFGNHLVTMTLTGAQIKQLLEQQFDNPVAGRNRILQVSSSFSYAWSPSAPAGDRVRDMRINGRPVIPSQNYRVTVNSFMADGGGMTIAFSSKARSAWWE
jgi:5'-nucleotidase/2',3'-cyclic phosphodiesterase and related esterases